MGPKALGVGSIDVGAVLDTKQSYISNVFPRWRYSLLLRPRCQLGDRAISHRIWLSYSVAAICTPGSKSAVHDCLLYCWAIFEMCTRKKL